MKVEKDGYRYLILHGHFVRNMVDPELGKKVAYGYFLVRMKRCVYLLYVYGFAYEPWNRQLLFFECMFRLLLLLLQRWKVSWNR